MTKETPPPKISMGAIAEGIAHNFLITKGLSPIARNYRTRFGEIDLIMNDNKTLVFIEVRYRSYDHFGSAAESITKKKQNRIIQTAQHFIMSRQVTAAIRFDVVAVEPDTSKKVTCNWIKNVFQDCL
ncbi:MAG TPA: YraN family protein [Methylococcaceae bacterium]|jgi:putative endonuclease|nr:YraN family protein [Methylococcaceae bacterium]HIA44788.1 YraN family protein [Methylococcaceae bacterium]HIB63117.1 YraN family protein [Methylococcaceae bacterium]HIN69335.1 YraN family protein [Methylococcales bacterium]HIO44209.1 YraN family protein [Methylococcales bacterium]